MHHYSNSVSIGGHLQGSQGIERVDFPLRAHYKLNEHADTRSGHDITSWECGPGSRCSPSGSSNG